MFYNNIIISVVFFLLLAFSHTVCALELDASYGQREGEVVYQIGGTITTSTGESGRVRFPLSELRFPINTSVINIGFSDQLNDKWILSVSWLENASSNPDDMIDSDWGINYDPADSTTSRDSLDIYSESQLEMDGRDVTVELFKKVQLGSVASWNTELGGGVLRQDYDFVASNSLQTTPSTPANPALYLSGETLKYEYTSTMVYVALKAVKQISENNRILVFGAYSPKVMVHDYDNHILRSKTSTGDTEGWGNILKAMLMTSLNKRSHMFILASYQKTVSNGIQTQRSYETGSYIEADVGLRNINEQKTLKVGLNIKF